MEEGGPEAAMGLPVSDESELSLGPDHNMLGVEHMEHTTEQVRRHDCRS